MPELPTCLCVRGLPPYDRLTAIYQAASELSGDGDLPDPVCVAGIPPFQRFSYIYEAFRDLAGGGSLPSQLCVAGESPQDQVSRIYQAVAIYADDSSLLSYECVRGMPMWQQWVEIYKALYLAAGSPDSLVNPSCVTIANLDVLSDVFCALTAQGNATLLASFYIPEIVDTFERSIAAGYTGDGDPDPFQREAAVDVLRDEHYQSGIDGQLVILEDDPTECVLVAPENIVAVGGEALFSASWDAIPVTVSLLRYEYQVQGEIGWTSNGTSTILTDIVIASGTYTLEVRAVSTSGVEGEIGESEEFSVEEDPNAPVAEDNFNAYANNASLADQVGWQAMNIESVIIRNVGGFGSFWATSQAMARSTAVFNSDHRCEITAELLTPGSFAFLCVGVRCQSGVDTRYWFQTDGTNWFLVKRNAGSQNVITSGTHSITSGAKIALEAVGAGSSTRLTAQVDTGSGWVDVTGCVNFDPLGTYIDGGSPGVGGDGGSFSTTLGDDFKGYNA